MQEKVLIDINPTQGCTLTNKHTWMLPVGSHNVLNINDINKTAMFILIGYLNNKIVQFSSNV
jgi:hypothetical protein